MQEYITFYRINIINSIFNHDHHCLIKFRNKLLIKQFIKKNTRWVQTNLFFVDTGLVYAIWPVCMMPASTADGRWANSQSNLLFFAMHCEHCNSPLATLRCNIFVRHKRLVFHLHIEKVLCLQLSLTMKSVSMVLKKIITNKNYQLIAIQTTKIQEHIIRKMPFIVSLFSLCFGYKSFNWPAFSSLTGAPWRLPLCIGVSFFSFKTLRLPLCWT